MIMSAYPWVSLKLVGGRRIALAQLDLGDEHSSCTGWPSSLPVGRSSVMGLPQMARLMGACAMDMAEVWNARVRSPRVAEGIRVLLGEEGHSDSDFFLIFFYDRLQEGNEVLNPGGVLLLEDVCAELAHQIGVVHLSGPPQTGSLIQRRREGNTGNCVWYRTRGPSLKVPGALK